MCESYLPVTDRALTLDEYLDFVSREVDPRDLTSVGASALKLRELANNRTFVTEILNRQLSIGADALAFYSSQSAILGASQSFSVRLNVWPVVSSNPRQRKVENGVYSYWDAHDHNFTFMTVGYYGPGYETIIYEYDRDSVVGRAIHWLGLGDFDGRPSAVRLDVAQTNRASQGEGRGSQSRKEFISGKYEP